MVELPRKIFVNARWREMFEGAISQIKKFMLKAQITKIAAEVIARAAGKSPRRIAVGIE